jgi:hypothetical protein
MGTQIQGSSVKIIYATEATFGVKSPQTDYQVLPYVSEGLRLSRNLISSRTIRSSRNPQAPVRGNVDVAGDISFELAPQHGRLLRHALGVLDSGSLGTYVYTVGTLPPGLTIEKQFIGIGGGYEYFQYIGCKINSLKMAFKAEGMVESSVSLMGATETLAASTADAAPDDFGHSPFDGFEAVITDSAGASIGDVTEIDFTLENNLDGSSYIIDGTGKRKSIPAGTAKVSGNLKALFEDITLYNKAINNTESSIKIVLTKGTGAGTAGNEKLAIEFGELLYHPQAPVVAGPQGVLVELPFEAYYNDGGNASAIKMTLLAPNAYC